MKGKNMQDDGHYTVSGEHDGSVLPSKWEHLQRQVVLLPKTNVRGGVYAGALEITGPCAVEGPVFSRENIEVRWPKDGVVSLGSCVAAMGAIITKGGGDKRILRCGADVHAASVNFQGAFVYGSIFAKGCVLKDSIVIGGVFATGRLQMAHTLVSTFQAGTAILGEGVGLWLPYAAAEKQISLEAPVRCYTLCSLQEWIEGEETPMSGYIDLTEKDVKTVWYGGIKEAQKLSRQLLTAGARVMDIRGYEKVLAYNRHMLEALTLRGHLMPEVSEQLDSEHLEQVLRDLIARGKTPGEANINP